MPKVVNDNKKKFIDFDKFLTRNVIMFEKQVSNDRINVRDFSNALYHYWTSARGLLKQHTLNLKQVYYIMRTYRMTYPSPGVHFGLLLSMMYFEPKQQTNLNAKRIKVENKSFLSELEGRYFFIKDKDFVKEIYRITTSSIRSDTIFNNSNFKITYSVFMFTLDYDTLCSIFKGITKYCVGIRFEEKNDDKCIVSMFTLKNDFYYFLIHLYSLIAEHTDMVFTSVKNLFKNNKQAYIVNSTFYLYCITTGSYLPIINSLEDEIKFKYIRLISTISYEGGCTALKNFSEYGWGPLSNIIFEAGITSSKKFLKKYPNRVNKVGGVFQNTFLNKPVNGSSLFSNFRIYDSKR